MKSKNQQKMAKQSSSKTVVGKNETASGSIRKEIVAYAKKYEWNPYAWGGTSLTKGADCSGFVQTVFKDNGIKIPRTSRQQASSGKEVALSKIKPADLIFYRNGAFINHVAIYIGDGKVISASSKKNGIRITDYDYRIPCKAVTYIEDN